jgi:hypothetical protein
VNLRPDEFRRAIDDALAEIDRVEEEMLELFAELLGPDAALRVASYAKAQEDVSPLTGLTQDRQGRADRDG